jgi:hypothetical protein
MNRSIAATVVALATLVSACNTVTSSADAEYTITPETSVLVVEGTIVEQDERFVTIIPERTVFHIPEKYLPGTGRFEQNPIPELGEPLEALTIEFAELPEDEKLVMFLSYLPRSPLDWEWRLKLALYPDTQRPVAGIEAATDEFVDRLLYEDEDPSTDTIPALIELLQEHTARAAQVGRGEPAVDGPRLAALSGVSEDLPDYDALVLERFLSADPLERQLSDILDDIPQGADLALTVEWEFQEAALAYDPKTIEFSAVGLLVDGVGVAGPILITDDAVVPFDSFVVKGQGFDVIGWTEDPFSIRSASTASVIGTVQGASRVANSVAGDSAMFIDLRNGFRVTWMAPHQLSERVGELLPAPSNEPRSETEEGIDR